MLRLVDGIHNYFRIPMVNDDVGSVKIVNVQEINQTVCSAVLRNAAIDVDNLDFEDRDQFLHGESDQFDENGKPMKFFGLVPFRICGLTEKPELTLSGLLEGKKKENDQQTKILCTVVARAVKVQQHTKIVAM